MTEYEIIQVLGQLLDDRLEHVARKTDIVQLSADIKADQEKLSLHLGEHEKAKAFFTKLKIILISGVLTGIVSACVGWVW